MDRYLAILRVSILVENLDSKAHCLFRDYLLSFTQNRRGEDL